MHWNETFWMIFKHSGWNRRNESRVPKCPITNFFHRFWLFGRISNKGRKIRIFWCQNSNSNRNKNQGVLAGKFKLCSEIVLDAWCPYKRSLKSWLRAFIPVLLHFRFLELSLWKWWACGRPSSSTASSMSSVTWWASMTDARRYSSSPTLLSVVLSVFCWK